MKSLNYIIIKIKDSYNNELKLQSGISIQINNSIETISSINRIGEVVSAPDFTFLEKGDLLVVHHNIARKKNGNKGELINSDFYLEDDLYYVTLPEAYMYKRGDSDWKALDPYVFVEPVKAEKKQFFITDDDNYHNYKGNIKQYGKIKYINDSLVKKGLNVGDVIIFSKFSEHEYIFDNNIYYRMKTSDILIQL